MNPNTISGKVSDEDDTTLDVGKHVPTLGEEHHPQGPGIGEPCSKTHDPTQGRDTTGNSMGEVADSNLTTKPPCDLRSAANEDTPQITQMNPEGDITSLTSAKLPLPYQVEGTKGIEAIYEHRVHHDPLERGSVDLIHHVLLNNRSRPTTPLTNERETNQPSDATKTPSKALDTRTFPGKVSGEEDTTLHVGNHAPKSDKRHHPSRWPLSNTMPSGMTKNSEIPLTKRCRTLPTPSLGRGNAVSIFTPYRPPPKPPPTPFPKRALFRSQPMSFCST